MGLHYRKRPRRDPNRLRFRGKAKFEESRKMRVTADEVPSETTVRFVDPSSIGKIVPMSSDLERPQD